MTIKELIKHLQEFDESHIVTLEIDTECGYTTTTSSVEDVQFKDGHCILYGCDY